MLLDIDVSFTVNVLYSDHFTNVLYSDHFTSNSYQESTQIYILYSLLFYGICIIMNDYSGLKMEKIEQ